MPVQIRVETDIALADLVRKKEEGYVVEETPHVGNLSVSTLAMLTLGLRAKLVDVTVGFKDRLFYPHCQIVNGAQKVIANPNVMTTHSKTIDCGTPLGEFHLRPFANSGMNVFTHSSWVASRRETIAKVIEAGLKQHTCAYGLFGRYVGKDGKVTDREPHPNLLDKVHKVTVSSTDEGWVVPNPFNILFDLVCGSMESGKDTVYMLSGQSMYRYITQPYRNFGSMDALISCLYDAARDYAFTELPKQLNVIMVPVPVVRNFVAPLRLKNQLDRKLERYDRLTADNARCGKKLADGQLSYAIMRLLKDKRRVLFSTASQSLVHVCADSETGSYYSQHDMDRDRDSIYVPDQIMGMPIRVMLSRVDRIQHLLA